MAFLQDLLYATPELPEGAVPHLLSAPPTLQTPLHDLLGEYRDVFPPDLPKQYPPDRGLGDAHEIPLVPDAKPVKRQMYRHSPKE